MVFEVITIDKVEPHAVAEGVHLPPHWPLSLWCKLIRYPGTQDRTQDTGHRRQDTTQDTGHRTGHRTGDKTQDRAQDTGHRTGHRIQDRTQDTQPLSHPSFHSLPSPGFTKYTFIHQPVWVDEQLGELCLGGWTAGWAVFGWMNNSWVSCAPAALVWDWTQANRFIVRRANHCTAEALQKYQQHIPTRL